MMNIIQNFFSWISGMDIGWLIVIVVFLYLLLFLQELIDLIKKIAHRSRSYHKIY